MRNSLLLLKLFVIIIFVLGCSPNEKYITEFKNKPVKYEFVDLGITYNEFFAKIAGLEGDVSYNCFTPSDESNPNIKCIEVIIKRTTTECKNIRLQYLLNTSTGFLENGYTEIDGNSEDISCWMQIILELFLDSESSYY